MNFVVIGKFVSDPGTYFTMAHDTTLTPDIEGLETSTCVIEETETLQALIEIDSQEERKEDGTVVRTKTFIPNPEVQRWLDEGTQASIEDRGYLDYVNLCRTRVMECRRLTLDTVDDLHVWLEGHDADLVAGYKFGVLEPRIIVVGVKNIDWDDEDF